MTPPKLIVAALALLSPTAAMAQAPERFEGMVKGTMSADGMDIEMVQYMKGSMARVDMTMDDGVSMSTIFDAQSGKMLMLVHDQKMWMDAAMMTGMFAGASQAPATSAKVEIPEFRRTEEVEEIAGYECRHYIFMFEGMEVDVCAAPGLGCFIPGAPAGLSRGGTTSVPELPQEAELWLKEFPDGFFVLRMTTEDGAASYVAEDLDPGLPADELFRPPENYKEMKM